MSPVTGIIIIVLLVVQLMLDALILSVGDEKSKEAKQHRKTLYEFTRHDLSNLLYAIIHSKNDLEQSEESNGTNISSVNRKIDDLICLILLDIMVHDRFDRLREYHVSEEFLGQCVTKYVWNRGIIPQKNLEEIFKKKS